MSKTPAKELERLIKIVKTLRGPDGCEWDRAQTPKTLVPYLLEESYEVVESINHNESQKLKEELGDLLLHIVFQAEIGEENQDFQLADSIANICDKLIRRHPHVFGDTKVNGISDIKKNWEQIKKDEGRKSMMEGLPKIFPALLQARRIQERAAEVNFDWETVDQVWEKIHEEVDELKEAIKIDNEELIEGELGDILFSIVNLSRFLKINPDEALRRTNKKFVRRFKMVEAKLDSAGIIFKDMSLEELDEIWNEVKEEEKKNP